MTAQETLSAQMICHIFSKLGYKEDLKTDLHLILRNENPPYRRLTIYNKGEYSKTALNILIREAGLKEKDFEDMFKE